MSQTISVKSMKQFFNFISADITFSAEKVHIKLKLKQINSLLIVLVKSVTTEKMKLMKKDLQSQPIIGSLRK